MQDSKGKKISDLVIEGDAEEHFIAAAYYSDGSEVPEEELLYLEETYPEYWLDYGIG